MDWKNLWDVLSDAHYQLYTRGVKTSDIFPWGNPWMLAIAISLQAIAEEMKENRKTEQLLIESMKDMIKIIHQ